MIKQPSDTHDRLRALMRSHVENTAVMPRPMAPTAIPIQSPSAVVKATPATQPTPVEQASAGTAWTPRYSLRLLPGEVSKINSIINATLTGTGERVTLTDILRVALGRVGERSPIGREEIRALRSTDGRRRTRR